MAVFISYNHRDSAFVDALAASLVKAKHNVWLDRWELNLGDSLTARIEQSLTFAAAILVVLSQNSVGSDWCKRELTAGLVRELEEKKTLVMPIVLDDCEIPLFLRDKLFADFRKNPRDAFNLINRSLARVSNPTASRVDKGNFHTDWSYDWKPKNIEYSEELWELRLTFVDHGPTLPYVVLSECRVYQVDGSHFANELRTGNALIAIKRVVNRVYQSFIDKGEPTGLITDNFPQFEAWAFEFSPFERYLAFYTFRRMGSDTGMDTVVHLGNNLRMACDHINETVKS